MRLNLLHFLLPGADSSTLPRARQKKTFTGFPGPERQEAMAAPGQWSVKAKAAALPPHYYEGFLEKKNLWDQVPLGRRNGSQRACGGVGWTQIGGFLEAGHILRGGGKYSCCLLPPREDEGRVCILIGAGGNRTAWPGLSGRERVCEKDKITA